MVMNWKSKASDVADDVTLENIGVSENAELIQLVEGNYCECNHFIAKDGGINLIKVNLRTISLKHHREKLRSTSRQ